MILASVDSSDTFYSQQAIKQLFYQFDLWNSHDCNISI